MSDLLSSNQYLELLNSLREVCTCVGENRAQEGDELCLFCDARLQIEAQQRTIGLLTARQSAPETSDAERASAWDAVAKRLERINPRIFIDSQKTGLQCALDYIDQLAKSTVETTVPPVTRETWMGWSDEGGGWIAAIHGSGKREDIEFRIEQDIKNYGRNRFGIRPIRVTLHVAEQLPEKAPEEHIYHVGGEKMDEAHQGKRSKCAQCNAVKTSPELPTLRGHAVYADEAPPLDPHGDTPVETT